MIDTSNYQFLNKNLSLPEGHDSEFKQVFDGIQNKNWNMLRKYFMAFYCIEQIDELKISKDIGKDLRSWEKTGSYKKSKEKQKEEDYTKFNISSILSAFSFAISLMFVKAVIMQNFVVSFAVDAIIGCVCFIILMRNYPIRYRVYKLYMEENQFLKLDVSSAIFCFLMKILLPAFIDISMIVLIANYFITVRKKFKNVLKNC